MCYENQERFFYRKNIGYSRCPARISAHGGSGQATARAPERAKPFSTCLLQMHLNGNLI